MARVGFGPRFAPNLSMLWQDQDPYKRFFRARQAGFTYAEMHFPQLLDRSQLIEAIHLSGIDLVLFDLEPGDGAMGELGLLCVPGREGEFRVTLESALRLAAVSGTRRLNVLAGIVPRNVSYGEAYRTAVRNLRAAVEVASAAGTTLLIEAINTTDRPGYLVPTVEMAAELAATCDGVRIQLDVYHVARCGEDPIASFSTYKDLVGHIQIADFPGRHEPGTGGLPLRQFLIELEANSYRDFIGLEYAPVSDTDEGLKWMASLNSRLDQDGDS